MKYQVFVSRQIPESGLKMLREKCDVDVWEDELPPVREVFFRRAHGKHALLTMLSDKIDGELMEFAGPQLRVVANYAVGYDNIDITAATERNIRVGNTPGVLTETTADLAFALLMAVNRRIIEGDRYVRAGEWKTWGPQLLRGYEMKGKTLGIVGFGRIGQAVARRAHGFGMRIFFFSPSALETYYPDLNASKVDLETLLRESDFITLHCPLNERSRKMIDESAIGLMKPTAILINTARGSVVDSNALFNALVEGRLAGAGLDVTDPEPILMDDPLLTLSNVVITPHVGSATHETRAAMAEMAADNILKGLAGDKLPYPVI